MIDIKDVLFKHQKWLNNEESGEKADLRDADLCYADLRYADLRYADLRDADLCYADLRYADLRYANLCYADLRGADLCYATNVDKVYWNMYTAFYPLQCPETGSFVAYKKAHGYIIKLEVCEDALRSSATSRKCRCSKAKVLAIELMNGDVANITSISSDYNNQFIYEVGKVVQVDDFDANRWNECSTGIHFFITRDEAVKY